MEDYCFLEEMIINTISASMINGAPEALQHLLVSPTLKGDVRVLRVLQQPWIWWVSIWAMLPLQSKVRKVRSFE
jgi:hypothetical protein